MNRFLLVLTPFMIHFGLNAALIIRPVDVIIRIEDANFKQKVVSNVSFAEQDIELGKASIADFRKEVRFQLMPGIYPLKWTCQSGDVKWVDKQEKHHSYLIEIEKKDLTVHIKIRGEDLSLY